MSTATPERRRALAPLDANKQSPTPARLKLGSNAPHLKKPVSPVSIRGLALSRSPVKNAGSEARKRPLEVYGGDENAVVKKTCVEMEVGSSQRATSEDATMTTERYPSASPDASSIFDSSGLDTQASTMTDMEIGDASRRPPMSRAQTRKMAGDLLARLRLANYKVRTGQAHVPFTQLEARSAAVRKPAPVPTLRVQQPSSPMSVCQADGAGSAERALNATRQQSAGPTSPAPAPREKAQSSNADSTSSTTAKTPAKEELTLPPLLSTASGLLTPRRGSLGNEEKLTSSVLRGGAVNGLLRLAHGGES